MGEVQRPLFEMDFNRSVKVTELDQRVTSDAGVIALREADHRLGLTESLANQLVDPRRQDCIRYQLVELLRERLYAMGLGYESQDDLDRLAHDPAMKAAVWNRPGDQVIEERLASQPTHSRLIDILARFENNREVVRDHLAEWVKRRIFATGGGHRVRRATVDVDSFPIEVHGNQEGSSYNGHYGGRIYHPHVASFVIRGDYDQHREGSRMGSGFLNARLRMGHEHCSTGAVEFLRETIVKAQQLAQRVDFRLDAGFAIGEVVDFLRIKNIRFVGRVKGNAVLDKLAAPHLRRPAGRPPKDGYERVVELGPVALGGWMFRHRMILVIVDRPDPVTGQLDLVPRHFVLVTGWKKHEMSAEEVLAHYRRRGTFEDRLGEFQQAVNRHLSSPHALDNEITFLLSLLAFNLVAFCREELEGQTDTGWDLRRFQNYVLKAGASIVKKSRRLYVRVAAPVLPFWKLLLNRIATWNLPSHWPSMNGASHCPWRPPPPHSHLHEVLRS